MGERSDQIERHIKATRSELEDDVTELEDKVRQATDWRTQFQKRPAAFIGAGFAVGALVAFLAPRWRHSHGAVDVGSPANYSPSGSAFQARKAYHIWDNVKGALMGVAAVSFRKFLEETIPGFREEYEATEDRGATGASDSYRNDRREDNYGGSYSTASGF